MLRNIPIPKTIRVTGYILLFITALIIIFAILFNLYFKKRLIDNIKAQVSESTNDKYTLSLDGLSINILFRTITLDNLIIAPTKKETSPKAQYVFQAKVLRIINFSVMSYLRKRDLLIERIEFDEPKISIFQGYGRLPKKKVSPDEINFSLYTAISKKLNSISIEQIDIMNSKFNIYENGIDTLSIFSSNDNSISIKKFKVNSQTDKQNRLFFAEKFDVVMNKFSSRFGNGFYSLYGKSLYASYTDSTLIVDSLHLAPNFSKKEFGKVADRQVSRVEIFASKINCQKMDVKSFFEYNWLIIHKVDLVECDIDVYRDNNLPLAHIKRPSVQKILKSLPFFVEVDTIEMKNGGIVSEELQPGQASVERIQISMVNGIITGVQNDTTSYSDKSSIKAELNCNFLNQAKFKETYTFPLKSTTELFYCSGSLTSMPMAAFNPVIRNTKHLTFESGQLDNASFSFVADENSANGTMEFLYHGLKVELENKGGEQTGLKQKLRTLIANEFIVIDSNPGKNGIVRKSKIHMEHNPYRYFVFYSMQSMLSGIAPAIKNEKNEKLLQKKKN